MDAIIHFYIFHRVVFKLILLLILLSVPVIASILLIRNRNKLVREDKPNPWTTDEPLS